MLKRFDSPQKRVGFLLLLLGATLTVAALMAFSVKNHIGDPVTNFFDRFLDGPYRAYSTFNHHNGGPVLLSWIGIPIAIVGGIMAFAYDRTIGRVVRWVRTGQ